MAHQELTDSLSVLAAMLKREPDALRGNEVVIAAARDARRAAASVLTPAQRKAMLDNVRTHTDETFRKTVFVACAENLPL